MLSRGKPHCEESPEPEEVQGDQVERMVLRGEDRDAFLAAVSAPPEPTERLLAALRRHREVLGASPEEALVEGFLLGRVARETVLRELGPERLDEIEYQRDALRRDVKKPRRDSST